MHEDRNETKKEDSKNRANKLLFIFICLLILFGAFASALAVHPLKAKNERVVGEPIVLEGSRFEIINEYTQSDGIDGSLHYYIAYDKVTKVMYVIGKSEGSSPTFTVMVSESGYPIRYGGSEE